MTSVESEAPGPELSALLSSVEGRTLVVKLGGSVGGEDTLPRDVKLLQELGARIVLAHGGGPSITEWLGRLGKQTYFVDGLRYTDEETLHVVRMVLSGLVNGDVVARLGAAGGRAVGLSGCDDHLLQAVPRDRRLGLVGDVRDVNPRPVQLLLDAGYAVVVAPVAVAEDGRFLNVNADTVAAELAIALGADRLIYLTDVDGVSDGTGRGPRRSLDAREARQLIADGVVDGGMIPKVDGCIRSVSPTRTAQIIDGRRPHALLEALVDPGGVGTIVVAG